MHEGKNFIRGMLGRNLELSGYMMLAKLMKEGSRRIRVKHDIIEADARADEDFFDAGGWRGGGATG